MNEESIFVNALARSTPAERVAFLDEACAGDAQLRERIDRLLGSAGREQGILERAPQLPLPSPASSLAPDRIFAGRFKLREKLGEGGMGEVWYADQLEPVQRPVALKVVRSGNDSKRMLARFEQERQALALMDHPNIARVLDAGVDEADRPYFVMELIKAVSITEYCDAARLSPRQRVELFISVCHAVQHAHQKGIIHRDLKPSNILVGTFDGRAVAKIIDFGVAKATGTRLTEMSVCTGIGALIGTLEYMSPEQAESNNVDVDTRTDIYALGAVLYELLIGCVPFSRKDLHERALVEMLRIIKEVEPARPSTKLSASGELASVAAVRQTEPKKLVALMRGDLDWIVIKCLEKNRGRRYETANGLAMDLQRYLANEPVIAGPPSMRYRMRKFVRRNRGPVLAGAMVILALVGGIFGTTVGLVRAEQRAEGERRAKESAEKRLAQIENGINILSSIFENLDPMAEEAEGRPLRAILGDRLDQAAHELEGEAIGDPLVVARLQDRLGRTYLGLGQGSRAEALIAKAVATRQDLLGADDALTLESRHNLAVAHEAAGHRKEAIQLLEQVRDDRIKTLGPDHLDTLNTLNELGVAYHRAGRLKEAVALLERVRDGRVQQLQESHDLTLETMEKLALAYLADERRADAIKLAESVWAARVKKHGDDHPKAIAAMGSLAYVYQGGYRMKDALKLFQDARDKIVPKLGDYHPLTLQILRNLGHMLRVYRRTDEAIPLLQQVRERELMVLGGHHPNTLVTLHELAGAYKWSGDLQTALPLYLQAAAGLEKLKYEHSLAQTILAELSVCHEELKQLKEAELARRKTQDIVRRKFGVNSAAYAEELIRLGSLLLQQKNPAAAETNLREALAIFDKQPNAGEILYAKSLLGQSLADRERYTEAEPLLIEAYERMKNFEAEHPGEGTLPIGRQVDAAARLVQICEALRKPDEASKWRKEAESQQKRLKK